MLIIGLDAASQFKNFGFALGNFSNGRVGVTEAGVFGNRSDALLSVLATRIRTQDRGLLAIDAPLGWPEAMGQLLKNHFAGQSFSVTKDQFFRRRTDEVLRSDLRRNPLEVGADRIARASHHALEVLQRLREMSGRPIPLAWHPGFSGIAAVEVYPAATLVSHQIEAKGYKSAASGLAVRTHIAKRLRGKVNGIRAVNAIASDHSFDACLCLLAARDFLEGEAAAPVDQDLAKREGWIWVRSFTNRSAESR